MYHVDFWGSHPEDGNDDCWSGLDFKTEAEAREFFDKPVVPAYCFRDTQFIVLSAGEFTISIKRNPDFQVRDWDRHDDDWRQEMEMEAGMLHGCDGYNEFCGY